MTEERQSTPRNGPAQWWLGRATAYLGVGDMIGPSCVANAPQTPLVEGVNFVIVYLIECPGLGCIKRYRHNADAIQTYLLESVNDFLQLL